MRNERGVENRKWNRNHTLSILFNEFCEIKGFHFFDWFVSHFENHRTLRRFHRMHSKWKFGSFLSFSAAKKSFSFYLSTRSEPSIENSWLKKASKKKENDEWENNEIIQGKFFKWWENLDRKKEEKVFIFFFFLRWWQKSPALRQN